MSFRVLIAEDEALNRKDLSEILTGLGYLVVAECKDGCEALEQIEIQQPDVVLLDVRMPKMDGLEVARQVSDTYPVIILTAYSSPDVVRKARDAGSMAYLTKPFREEDIMPAVELAVTHFVKEAHLSEKVRHLDEQLQSRKLIERAKSILMDKTGISERNAFRQMQELSMKKNIPMNTLAEEILKTAKD